MLLEQSTFTGNVSFQKVSGLVFIGDEIIVIRRKASLFQHPLEVDLPGGVRKAHETPFETFSRSINESLDISLKQQDIIFSKKHTDTNDETLNFYFMVAKPLDMTEKDISFGNIGLEFHLTTVKDFLSLQDGISRQQERVIDYLETIKKSLA